MENDDLRQSVKGLLSFAALIRPNQKRKYVIKKLIDVLLSKQELISNHTNLAGVPDDITLLCENYGEENVRKELIYFKKHISSV